MAEENGTVDEVVGKYKRLLSMARSSLEANQATMAEKDKYIQQLKAALEEEKNNHSRVSNSSSTSSSKRGPGGKEEETLVSRSILRRVDVEDRIWALFEYEGGVEDRWISFGSEEDLDDFVQRLPGVPLIKPPKCLTPAEAFQIESECKKKVDRIVEEFRRFKVKTEIARKQKDAESKQSFVRGSLSGSGSPSGSVERNLNESGATSTQEDPYNGSPNLDANGKALSSMREELQRLQTQLSEQDNKWRQAYEKISKENEFLRNKGGESLIAQQWRERYENCLKERDEANEKLKSLVRGSSDSIAGSGVVSGKSLEQAYIELKDEHKEFRKRFVTIQDQRETEQEELRQRGIVLRGAQSSPSVSRSPNPNSSIVDHHGYSHSGPVSSGLETSKVQYIKQMIFQYLSCREPEVKLHMETALVAIFRFSDAEKATIEERKRDEMQDTLSSITNFLGSFASP